MRNPLRGRVSGGRWIVLGGSAVGAAFFIGLLATGSAVFSAFWKGGVAFFLVMVLAGTAQSFWRGNEVAEAQGPGGMGLKFFGATRRTLRLMEERLKSQMDLINRRLYELEKAVFKGSDDDSEGKE
jgi:hypothetical protein